MKIGYQLDSAKGRPAYVMLRARGIAEGRGEEVTLEQDGIDRLLGFQDGNSG